MRAKIKSLFTGTLPLFLVLWALMMAVLGAVDARSQGYRIYDIVQSAQQSLESQYVEIWEGTAPEEQKPVILTWRISGSALDEYGGSVQFRFYDLYGQELTRSQLTIGTACPYGTGTYSWTLLLDPVLTEAEQLELAERLKADRELQRFYGTAGGTFDAEETDGLYCEVTGVADPELQVVYPKKVTYHYNGWEVTLIYSQSGFFDGKELTTLRFDAVQFSSALVGENSSPRELLFHYKKAGERLDKLTDGLEMGAAAGRLGYAGSHDGAEIAAVANGTVYLASSYSYSALRLTARSIWPTALLTLLAAVAIAASTDRRQQAALQRERAFTQAAAHELKTPLAVLRSHAEALKEDIDPAKRGEYLDVVLDESDRMAALVGQLLDLSRLEVGAPLKREPVDFTALVRESFDRLALPMEQKGLRLTMELSPGTVSGDRARLAEAVGNLASNALRYTPAGGNVSVRLENSRGKLWLAVDNDGPNFTAEELSRLWEPFYRGDPARSRDTGGAGLGLAIVRAVVRAHGGACGAENRPGGVRFWVELPALQSDQ